MEKMFSSCYKLESIDLSGFDTSNVTNMEGMFSECYILSSIKIPCNVQSKVLLPTGTWKDIEGNQYTELPQSKATSFEITKAVDENLEIPEDAVYFGSWNGMTWSIDADGELLITGVDTRTTADYEYATWRSYEEYIKTAVVKAESVKSTYFWFNGCSSLESVDVSAFDTSMVSDMSGMFRNCSSLASVNLNIFNTNNVTNMSSMFSGCSQLENIDVSNFETSSVTNMGWMFADCSKLKELVVNFDTSNVTNMGGMFSGCKSLESIDVSNFDAGKVTYIQSMFSNCDSLTSINVPVNVSVETLLPSGTWKDVDGNTYTVLPLNVAISFEIIKMVEKSDEGANSN